MGKTAAHGPYTLYAYRRMSLVACDHVSSKWISPVLALVQAAVVVNH